MWWKCGTGAGRLGVIEITTGRGWIHRVFEGLGVNME